MKAHLYAACDAAAIPWPQTPDGEYARRYLAPLLHDGPGAYVENAHAKVWVARVADAVVPVTVNQPHPDNSYVVSPYAHYFAYGGEELRRIESAWLRAACRAALTPLQGAYRWTHFDEAVYVNNWLLSTNLYPALSPDSLAALHAALLETFANRPIVFRSLDACGNPDVLEALVALGYALVFSRQVYYQDVRTPGFWNRKQLKVDAAFYRRTPYRLLGHSAIPLQAAPRLRRLYELLYLEKHSRHNPRFTTAFLRRALAEQLLTVKAFEIDGRIDAVLGYVRRNGVMTQPLFGYDTGLPQGLGLYRLLSHQVLLEARANGCRVNASAGVGAFKRLRGGVPALEYNAVYDRHLPRARRAPWRLLRAVLERVGVPLIQKQGF